MPAVLALVLLIESDPRPSEEVALEIVRACERVRDPEPCRFAETETTEGEWRAQVTAPSEHETRIELRDRETGERIVRTLRFRPEDSLFERAKTVGLTLGVLAKSRDDKADERPPAEPEPPARVPVSPASEPAAEEEAPPRAEAAASSERSVALAAALMLLYDPSLAAAALGGRAGVSVPFAREWETGVRLEVARTLGEPATLSLLEVRGLWSLGLTPNDSRLSPYLGLGASYLDATVGAFPYRNGRLAFYAEVGVAFVLARSGPVEWTLTPHLGFSPNTTRFSLGSEPIAETAPVILGLSFGVRAEP